MKPYFQIPPHQSDFEYTHSNIIANLVLLMGSYVAAEQSSKTVVESEDHCRTIMYAMNRICTYSTLDHLVKLTPKLLIQIRDTINMQEKRQMGQFHLTQEAAIIQWKNTILVAIDWLEVFHYAESCTGKPSGPVGWDIISDKKIDPQISKWLKEQKLLVNPKTVLDELEAAVSKAKQTTGANDDFKVNSTTFDDNANIVEMNIFNVHTKEIQLLVFDQALTDAFKQEQLAFQIKHNHSDDKKEK